MEMPLQSRISKKCKGRSKMFSYINPGVKLLQFKNLLYQRCLVCSSQGVHTWPHSLQNTGSPLIARKARVIYAKLTEVSTTEVVLLVNHKPLKNSSYISFKSDEVRWNLNQGTKIFFWENSIHYAPHQELPALPILSQLVMFDQETSSIPMLFMYLTVIFHQWPLLLTWFNFNPSMDK